MIDLGDELKIEVKYNGQTYEIREPRVEEIDAFRETDDKTPAGRVTDFLAELGMPRDVISTMSASKVKALVDGLMAQISKKN